MRNAIRLLALLLLAACGDSTAPARPAEVVVSPADVTLEYAGETAQLSAQVVDDDGRIMGNVPVTWSAPGSTVEVSTGGEVTALAAGTVQVTATAEGATGRATVTVLPPVEVLIESASQRHTDINVREVTLALANEGGRGFFEVEFWSLRNDPSASQHRFWGSSQEIEVGPGYQETLVYNVPASSDVGWVIVYVRDPGSGTYFLSDCYRFGGGTCPS